MSRHTCAAIALPAAHALRAFWLSRLSVRLRVLHVPGVLVRVLLAPPHPCDADAFVTLISQGTDHKPVAAHLTACAPVLEQVSLDATAGRLFVVADFAFAIRPLPHLVTGVKRVAVIEVPDTSENNIPVQIVGERQYCTALRFFICSASVV